jgi:hypothetical protein
VFLRARPSEELSFSHLLLLSDLFPSGSSLGIEQLRNDLRLAIQHQRIGLDTIRAMAAP